MRRLLPAGYKVKARWMTALFNKSAAALSTMGRDNNPTRRATMRHDFAGEREQHGNQGKKPYPHGDVRDMAASGEAGEEKNAHCDRIAKAASKWNARMYRAENHQGRHDVRHDEACEISRAREWDEQGHQNEKSRHGSAAVETAQDEEQPGEHQGLCKHCVPDEHVHMGEQQEQAVEGAAVELRRENQIIAGIRVEKGKPVEKRRNEEGERRSGDCRHAGDGPVVAAAR